MVIYGGIILNKGDIITVYYDGEVMTLCVLGFYNEQHSGEEMVLLALITRDNLLHVSLEDLESMFFNKRNFN
jgi:hypothetical protein